MCAKGENVKDFNTPVRHHTQQEGRMAILLVEQYLDFARRLADHIYVMEQGIIVLEGNMQELQEDAVKRSLAV